MTLSEFIIEYRKEHNMSSRAFARMVKMSPQQITNIEHGVGSNGKPMTSTMKTYKKIAEAIGMTEQDFLNMLNDNVLVNPNEKSPDILAETLSDNQAINELMRLIPFLNDQDVDALLSQAKELISSQQDQGVAE